MNIYSILIGTLAGILIVSASFFALSQQNALPEERVHASSLVGPTNVFDIFKHTTQPPTQSEDIQHIQQKQTTQDDYLALESLARAWAQRRTDLQKSFPALQTTLNTTQTTTEPEDIFASLMGPKLTDALKNDTALITTPQNVSELALWGGTSTTTSASTIQKTETTYAIQKELHDYGNNLGAILTTFLQSQGDQSATLSLYLEHRSDTVAQEKLKNLTDAYEAFSKQLASLTAPAPLAQNHTNLIQGYARIGTELWKITDATTDGELYNKLIAYNTVAEDVARSHITVTTVFTAYGVTFAPGEAGNAFVFDGVSGSGALSL